MEAPSLSLFFVIVVQRKDQNFDETFFFRHLEIPDFHWLATEEVNSPGSEVRVLPEDNKVVAKSVY